MAKALERGLGTAGQFELDLGRQIVDPEIANVRPLLPAEAYSANFFFMLTMKCLMAVIHKSSLSATSSMRGA
ncbi:MAG: hypothetical protein QOJ86_129 [Bradyrhizobium sp.]|nr:hypothetical protein [Bradyrhizobium sp.]